MKIDKRKITKIDQLKMKALHKEFGLTFKEIGLVFGVSKQRVHQIIRGK